MNLVQLKKDFDAGVLIARATWGKLLDLALQPTPMVLFCPSCGVQHIDAAEEFKVVDKCTCAGPDQCEACYYAQEAHQEWLASDPWTNPPHRSHLCHACGHIWRPADVPTTGVVAVATKGSVDSPVINADTVRVVGQREAALVKAGAGACYDKVYTFGGTRRAFCDMGFDFAAIAASVPLNRKEVPK